MHALTKGLVCAAGVVLVALTPSCDRAAAEREAPRPQRILVFWDFSGSISDEERARWKAWLRQRSSTLGSGLWSEEENDEMIVMPLHGATGRATPTVEQRFTGGEFKRNVRSREHASLNAQLAVIDTVHLPRNVLNHTDLIGATTRIRELAGDGTHAVVEVIYLSDMMHSMPDLDFESRRSPIERHDIAALVEAVIERQEWRPGMLEGTKVRVRLPGTISGSSPSATPDRVTAVERFWRALFTHLGAEIVEWQRR